MSAELLDDFGIWLVSWGAAESTVQVRLRVVSAFCEDYDPLTVAPEEITRHLEIGDWHPDVRAALDPPLAVEEFDDYINVVLATIQADALNPAGHLADG